MTARSVYGAFLFLLVLWLFVVALDGLKLTSGSAPARACWSLRDAPGRVCGDVSSAPDGAYDFQRP